MNAPISSFRSSGDRVVDRFQAASCAVASWSVLAMGLHLWPFEGRHSLEMIAPVNLGIILWLLIAMASAAFSRQARQLVFGCLPDVSVWMFLAIAAASMAFSPHMGQSASSLGKLALMYVGTFVLLRVAFNRNDWASHLCIMALTAACVAMIASIASRLLGQQGFGFFANPYKYGTAMSILFVLGAVHLACRQSPRAWLIVPASALAAVATASLGGLCGMIVGLAAGVLLLKQRTARLRLTVCLLALAAIIVVLWRTPVLSHLREDVWIGEPNGRDLRQRYIEWQAQLNLIGRRPVAGTGLGCVNEYRSMFYGRLPKLNTLAAFDRNGWLLIAAETGFFGLVAFMWLIISAGRKAWQAARTDGPQAGFGVVAFAALAAVCISNTFSSINYNGVLNAFVFALALAHHADRGRNE